MNGSMCFCTVENIVRKCVYPEVKWMEVCFSRSVLAAFPSPRVTGGELTGPGLDTTNNLLQSFPFLHLLHPVLRLLYHLPPFPVEYLGSRHLPCRAWWEDIPVR